ncbi:MAG: NnrS family protein, partial [Alphaproteobacteria bacterium]
GSRPLLWVLHLGYGWLVLGLALKAAAELTPWLPPSTALHALTVGAIGTIILAVMSRAALGHTGRPLAASRLTVAAYLLVSAAALLRAAAPLLPELYSPLLVASGVSWSLAFALFSAVYLPILVAPRADGLPG